MNDSPKKTGYTIGLLIFVIAAVGVGVEWWDARYSNVPPVPAVPIEADAEAARIQELQDEISRLKVESALMSVENDRLKAELKDAKAKAEAPQPVPVANHADPAPTTGSPN